MTRHRSSSCFAALAIGLSAFALTAQAQPTITCPPDITLGIGTCTATVVTGSPTIGGTCPGGTLLITAVRSDNPLLTPADPFPLGLTTITWTVNCSSLPPAASCVQRIQLNNKNALTANVQLLNISSGTFTRCITFDLYNGSCPGPAATVTRTITFNNGLGSDTFPIPCGTYTAITARDRLHTLRRTADAAHFTGPGPFYVVNFIDSSTTHGASDAGNDALIGGNLNDDRWIDILDFGIYHGLFGHTYAAPGTTCADIPPQADINGDRSVNLADYTFISTNFLLGREADPCGTAIAEPPPVTDISVFDLVNHPGGGWEMARTADVNRDGRLNLEDLAYASQHAPQACPADFNSDGIVGVSDIFSFLNNWFQGFPAADFNDDHTVSTQDIFSFLAAWFGGCP